MKHIISNFRRYKIKKQYSILIVFSFLIMLLLSLLILFQARQAILQTSNTYASMLSFTFASEIASVTEQANAICEQLQYSDSTASLLHADSWHDIKAETIKQLIKEKSSIQEVNNSVADIAFVSDIVNWSSLYTKEQLTEMAADMQDKSKINSLGIRYGGLPSCRDIPYLVFGAPIYTDYQPTGYLFISIHLSRLSLPVFRQNNINTYFLLADSKLHTFAFNCEQGLAETIIKTGQLEHILSSPEKSSSPDSITSKNYAISLNYVSDADCYIINAVNIYNTTAQLRYINILCWTVVTMTLLLLALLYFVLYNNYVKPIRAFNRTIQETEENHLRTLKKPLDLQGCEEIHQIGNSFTSLLTSINELNRKIVCTANELYEMELQKKIAELSFLRSQINPHFIYNALELIRDIASEHSVPCIGEIAVSMGKILRYSVKGDDMVPLRQEINITMAYINIQQARFHNRITILKNFQDDTLDLQVNKMLLQPLVENAIFHGIEPKAGTATLYLSSVLEADILKISIRDNGVGIPEELLKELQSELKSPLYDTSRHVGLVNTNARIRLQYGADYGISLDSREDDGTCLILTLPAVYLPERGGL